MSSVLVKGMKMPESCYYCGLADTSFINCMAFEKPILLEDDCEEKRPDWCPLVALPDKHGRLMDADALIADIRKNSASYFADDFAHEWVDRQPTIVEAEGET